MDFDEMKKAKNPIAIKIKSMSVPTRTLIPVSVENIDATQVPTSATTQMIEKIIIASSLLL